MAVYRREYSLFTGPRKPAWSRFLVIPRYCFGRLFRSRLLLALFVACFVWPLGSALVIYLHHNLSALGLLRLKGADLVPIDGRFFLLFLSVQSTLGFLLTALVGPGLISADLANNALPLYFSRPFSRTQYVTGKLSVLLILLSSITWMPALLLFALQVALEGQAWWADHAFLGPALLLCSGIWIVVISLLALALSAWVRWKPVAGALLFVVFFAGAAFGEAVNATLGVQWGGLLNIGRLMGTLWSDLLALPIRSGLSPGQAWAALGLLSGLCLLLLARRLRTYRVARP